MNKSLFNSYANTIKQLKLINNFSSLRENAIIKQYKNGKEVKQFH